MMIMVMRMLIMITIMMMTGIGTIRSTMMTIIMIML